jgi:hypothetical protein
VSPNARAAYCLVYRLQRYGRFRGRCASSGFNIRRLAIAHGDQFFLELRPFVGRHHRLLALGHIFYRKINACFRKRGCLSPRVYQ